MKLTVLGRHGPFPAPGGACSGYLIQAGSQSIVLDLGSGTLSNLRRVMPGMDISGIILSHLHSDHMADMLILRYALSLMKDKGLMAAVPLTVVAPETPELEYRQLAGAGVFEMVPAKAGMKLRFGEMTLTLYESAHPVETYAIDIEHEGKHIFYTGDTRLHPELKEQCRGADILLADVCFLNEEKPGEMAPHMTAMEAGILAREAEVGQLICTHLWGGREDHSLILTQVKEQFANAMLAEEMHEYHV